MAQKDKSHSAIYKNKPWAENNNNIWLASTINIHRNIDKFHFPEKLGKDKRNQIISLLGKPLLQSARLKGSVILKTEELGPNEKEYLMEHFLSTQSFHQAHSGEAFLLDESGTFLTTINVGNHVQFELIDCRAELESSWNHMVKIETELGTHVNYAFSPKFGFLTADPTMCGTAFILKVFLQPSALIHTGKLKPFLEKTKMKGITVTGLQGNPSEIIGDIYSVMNDYTLGLTEENIISSVRLFTTKLLVEETTLRNHLRKEDNPELKDKVSRAFGVLIHSYKIEPIEALDAISLLKLGSDLGWLEGLTPQNLNRIFFDCRRAHLLTKFEEEIPPEEIPHKRAEYIHKALGKAKLLI